MLRELIHLSHCNYFKYVKSNKNIITYVQSDHTILSVPDQGSPNTLTLPKYDIQMHSHLLNRNKEITPVNKTFP